MLSIGARSPEEEVERWRALVDHMPALIGFWDRDLRNVTANAAYEQWLGRSPSEIRGMHLRDLLGPATYAANLPHVEAALAGEQQRFERTLVTADGRTRHTQADYIPVIDEAGVNGFYVLVADITPQVEAQRDLQAAQALAHVGSYTIEPATGTLRLSPELVRILGFDEDGPGPTMQEYLDAVHPHDRGTVEGLLEQATRGQEYDGSYRIVRPDGAVRHVHSRTSQVRGPAGEVLLLRGVMQDATEVHVLADELAATNRSLSDLIAMLGHDLAEPVAVTNGYLELLAHEAEHPDPEDRATFLDRARRAGTRVENLLSDVLTLVNVDSTGLVTRPEAVDVVEILTTAAEHLRLELSVATTTTARARADRRQLARVVDNLLSNARYYGRPPYVATVGRRVGEGGAAELVVSLRDHGEGVPPEFVPHLFDRFARAGSGVATTRAGTGFGLYLVRELARANGGTVVHRQPDGPGAVFELRLPVEPAPS